MSDSRRARCVLPHPHPGRECRPWREVHRNRWGGAPQQPPVEVVEGQLALDDLGPDGAA